MKVETIKKPLINRRRFLGGAAVTLALPFLPSLAPKGARAQSEVPKRMLAWYIPCGIHMADWTPAETGSTFTLPSILQPLGTLQEDIIVVTGLFNRPARPDGPGDHASGTGAFITAAHPFKTAGEDIRNGISMDQVAANQLGMATRFPSLQLGINGGGGAGDCDSGYSCAYANNISWADADTPITKLTNPQTVFDRLFAGFDMMADAEAQARRRVYQTSVLDYVLEEANQLHGKLGAVDKLKLEEYMNGVREVERRITGFMGPMCTPPDRPLDGFEVQEHIDIMSDLQVMAMQCDLTRIITFMMANAGDGRNYSFIGAPGGHHDLSHHAGDPAKQASLSIIDRWEIERFAYFLNRAKAVTEADGTTLLDNCTIFYSSEISDGDRHNHNDMPILLAGKCGTAFRTGQHVRYEGEPTVANLFITMLHAMGVMVDRFGDDGTEPLNGLG
jgi:hypothetical protein